MKVIVTAEDIQHGIARNGCECPVALAVRRALGLPSNETDMHCSATGIRVGNRTMDVPLGHPVQKFIDKFDNMQGGDEPFEFELTL